MAWWMVAAAAAPYVVSALQKKPKRPGAPQQAPLKDRDAEIEAMLNESKNPNTQVFNLASEQAAEQVNRLLGRTGMGGSSVGAQLQANTQSKLAQAWLEEQAQRQHRALNLALDYDRAKAGHAQQGNNAAYSYAMDTYKDLMQRNANQVQGMSNMIGAGVNMYNQDRYMTALENSTAPPQTQPQPQAQYGVPGGQLPANNYNPWERA